MSLREKVKILHWILVLSGRMEEARRVLWLLRYGRVTLGLGDNDWGVQEELERIGCPVRFSRDGYWAYATC